MKYKNCIICGEANCLIEEYEFCVSSEFDAVCEKCHTEYQEELAEKAKNATEIVEATKKLELPF